MQEDDTIAKIAARCGVSPSALARRSKLFSSKLIVQGKTLIIPAPDNNAIKGLALSRQDA